MLNNKKVVYSVLIGNYDKVPKLQKCEGWDFYLYTDIPKEEIPKDSQWKIVEVERKKGMSPSMLNRWYKMHPHVLFPDYQYSIYLDANIWIDDFSGVANRVEQLIDDSVSLALPNHPERDCIYKEARAVIEANKDTAVNVYRTIKYLRDENYPNNQGLYENNLIFRAHHEEKVKELMGGWWDFINKYSGRDQLSLYYLLSQSKVIHKPFFDGAVTPRNHQGFTFIEKHEGSDGVKERKLKGILIKLLCIFVPKKTLRKKLRSYAKREEDLDSLIEEKYSIDSKMLPMTEESIKTDYFRIHRLYYRQFGIFPNLKNPVNLNEKIQWLKLFDRNDIMPLCADKYRVREYVGGKGLGDTLVDLYGVYETFDEINFDAFPSSFVLKLNHLSGGVFLYPTKDKLDKGGVKKLVDEGLLHQHGVEWGEWSYGPIERKIIVEEYIGALDGNPPADYKFHCFNGKVQFLQCIYDRGNVTKEFTTDENYIQTPYHIDWDFELQTNLPEKPENWDDLIRTAEILAEDFLYVRVDLYNVDKKIIFGELTFYPKSGLYPSYDSFAYGETWSLPKLQ